MSTEDTTNHFATISGSVSVKKDENKDKNHGFEMKQRKEKEQQVSPELAATIVKNYILPMFEGVNGKNDKAFNKLKGINQIQNVENKTVLSEL